VRIRQHANDVAKRLYPFSLRTQRLSAAPSIGAFIVPSDARWGVYIYCE
jgi:hypothetical protein